MTELLYANIHKTCHHYEKQESPIIKTVKFDNDTAIEVSFNTIVVVLEGKGGISYGKNINKPMKKEDILLIPVDTQVRIKIHEKANVLVFRLNPSFHFCDHFSLEALYTGIPKRKRQKFNLIPVNDRLRSYVDSLLLYLEDGLKCRYFLELKTKELFYILRAYCTEKELKSFFTPILSKDMEFHSFVVRTYQSTKTVKELAQKANYSLTGFEKRFKKVFGTTAHNWISEQLASNLYHEIHCTKRTFTELSKTFGFSSSAHLTSFCKSMFGMSPSDMRKGDKTKDNK